MRCTHTALKDSMLWRYSTLVEYRSAFRVLSTEPHPGVPRTYTAAHTRKPR